VLTPTLAEKAAGKDAYAVFKASDVMIGID
jgi:molybdopterin-binding protein